MFPNSYYFLDTLFNQSADRRTIFDTKLNLRNIARRIIFFWPFGSRLKAKRRFWRFNKTENTFISQLCNNINRREKLNAGPRQKGCNVRSLLLRCAKAVTLRITDISAPAWQYLFISYSLVLYLWSMKIMKQFCFFRERKRRSELWCDSIECIQLSCSIFLLCQSES